MASPMQIVTTKRNRRRTKQGRARKRKLSKKSTASYAELFAELGPPSEPKKSAQEG